MFNRLAKLIQRTIQYKKKRTIQFLSVYFFAVILLVTVFHQSSRLKGAYEGTNNSSIVFHGESFVTNLDGTDAWDEGTYSIRSQQLSITIDGQTYYGKMDKDQKHFWVEIDSEKVWFERH
ncbi:hypothetical protein SAMN05660453_0223 [Fructobacillus durionis]|uniref:Uncharacterized protein n=2 Tax=Fructobacillus durionis TaxID=283737 RepID=A0A1I1DZU1_9LACO|nr:hypothetical protein SAMN05660453_0223 [Fructobacillus durionis]